MVTDDTKFVTKVVEFQYRTTYVCFCCFVTTPARAIIQHCPFKSNLFYSKQLASNINKTTGVKGASRNDKEKPFSNDKSIQTQTIWLLQGNNRLHRMFLFNFHERGNSLKNT